MELKPKRRESPPFPAHWRKARLDFVSMAVRGTSIIETQTMPPAQSMSPPGPGRPRGMFAMTFLVAASTRVTEPSPWFNVHTEPAPAVRKRGPGPTGIETITFPLEASMAVRTFDLVLVTQTMSPLETGL